MEHIVEFVCFAPMVEILDAPVPQMVEQLPDVVRFFDTSTPAPEQVVEVPKILPEDVPHANRCSRYAAGGTVGGSAGGAWVRTCGGCLEGLFEAVDPWGFSLRTGFTSVGVRAS